MKLLLISVKSSGTIGLVLSKLRSYEVGSRNSVV